MKKPQAERRQKGIPHKSVPIGTDGTAPVSPAPLEEELGVTKGARQAHHAGGAPAEKISKWGALGAAAAAATATLAAAAAGTMTTIAVTRA